MHRILDLTLIGCFLPDLKSVSPEKVGERKSSGRNIIVIPFSLTIRPKTTMFIKTNNLETHVSNKFRDISAAHHAPSTNPLMRPLPGPPRAMRPFPPLRKLR